MPMIPPVATTRMAPRSTFTRRRSRPGTVPWGRSGRPASCAPGSGSGSLGRVCAVASRGSSGSAAVGRLFASGRSPDSEKEVPPERYSHGGPQRRVSTSRDGSPRLVARSPPTRHSSVRAAAGPPGPPRHRAGHREPDGCRDEARLSGPGSVGPRSDRRSADRRLSGRDGLRVSAAAPAGFTLRAPRRHPRRGPLERRVPLAARFEVDRAVGRCVRAPVAVARSTCMTPVVFGAAVV